MVSTDTGLTDYLSTVLEQMSGMILYMPKQKSLKDEHETPLMLLLCRLACSW